MTRRNQLTNRATVERTVTFDRYNNSLKAPDDCAMCPRSFANGTSRHSIYNLLSAEQDGLQVHSGMLGSVLVRDPLCSTLPPRTSCSASASASAILGLFQLVSPVAGLGIVL